MNKLFKKVGRKENNGSWALSLRGLRHHLPRRAAFTLAEVLITLGVIGVVAALTLPTLIQNYQKHVAVNRLKVVYNIMSNVIRRAEADFGIRYRDMEAGLPVYAPSAGDCQQEADFRGRIRLYWQESLRLELCIGNQSWGRSDKRLLRAGGGDLPLFVLVFQPA